MKDKDVLNGCKIIYKINQFKIKKNEKCVNLKEAKVSFIDIK